MRPVRVPHCHHMTLTLSNPRLMTGGPDGQVDCVGKIHTNPMV